MPLKFRELLQEVGNNPVVKVQLGRTPVLAVLTFFLNIVSLGKFYDKQIELGYDQIYHNYLLITIENDKSPFVLQNMIASGRNATGTAIYKLEKAQRIALKKPIFPTEFADIYDIPLTPSKLYTLNRLITAATNIDKDFYTYDAGNNNMCQTFVENIVDINGLTQNIVDEKTRLALKPQDAKALVETLGSRKDIVKRITDLGGKLDKLIHDKRIQWKKPEPKRFALVENVHVKVFHPVQNTIDEIPLQKSNDEVVKIDGMTNTIVENADDIYDAAVALESSEGKSKSMHIIFIILGTVLCVLAIGAVGAVIVLKRKSSRGSTASLADNKTEHAIVIDSLDIAPVWAGHPVSFVFLTHAPYQFVAYYDATRQMTVVQRNLNERTWTVNKLPIVTGWDSHNYIVMAIDDDGYLHLSGNMHVVPLVYFRTSQPLNASTFVELNRMIGTDEKNTTYPIFFRGPSNEFLFTYRSGMSGNGNQIYNKYDLITKTWSRLLDKPFTDGEGKRNAYFDGPIKGPDGYFHLAWVWRESPDASTNHDLSYARSKDLLSWETGSGRALTLPITLETCEIVDPVPQKGGIINGNTKIGFDQQGRVTISYHKNDAQNYTQPWTARLENGVWKKYQITNWPWHWDFGGGGTLTFAISLGRVTKEGDGNLTQSFSHIKFGNGTWLIDPVYLNATGKLQRETIPPSMLKVEGTFPGLGVRLAEDSGEYNVPSTRFVLRWETLGTNRDQPRPPPYPSPSMLRIYTVKVVWTNRRRKN
ncbi:unnamed protein product [Adineta ricciae]|uniref:Uncharacterized protein n=1 Tax=Adineta ricciae TaxID=249248 RepID=A0A815LBC9_ADIRI|nr:unnamed protein product [Adineta ricciae]